MLRSGVECVPGRSKRLRLRLPDEEMESVCRLAKAERLSVGESVR